MSFVGNSGVKFGKYTDASGTSREYEINILDVASMKDVAKVDATGSNITPSGTIARPGYKVEPLNTLMTGVKYGGDYACMLSEYQPTNADEFFALLQSDMACNAASGATHMKISVTPSSGGKFQILVWTGGVLTYVGDRCRLHHRPTASSDPLGQRRRVHQFHIQLATSAWHAPWSEHTDADYLGIETRSAIMRNSMVLVVVSAFAVALAAALSPSRAHSDDEYVVTPSVTLGPERHDLKVGPKMDAAGRDLHGSEFVGQDLTGARFDGCALTNVVFTDCDLSHASFRGAVFGNARIRNLRPHGRRFRERNRERVKAGRTRADNDHHEPVGEATQVNEILPDQESHWLHDRRIGLEERSTVGAV